MSDLGNIVNSSFICFQLGLLCERPGCCVYYFSTFLSFSMSSSSKITPYLIVGWTFCVMVSHSLIMCSRVSYSCVPFSIQLHYSSFGYDPLWSASTSFMFLPLLWCCIVALRLHSYILVIGLVFGVNFKFVSFSFPIGFSKNSLGVIFVVFVLPFSSLFENLSHFLRPKLLWHS